MYYPAIGSVYQVGNLWACSACKQAGRIGAFDRGPVVIDEYAEETTMAGALCRRTRARCVICGAQCEVFVYASDAPVPTIDSQASASSAPSAPSSYSSARVREGRRGIRLGWFFAVVVIIVIVVIVVVVAAGA